MFLYSHWLQLSISTRHLIAHQFGIAKTQPTHVSGDRIVEDGYKIQDVEAALNIDAIQKFVGAESADMSILWNMLLSKIEGREIAREFVDDSMKVEIPEGIEIVDKEEIVVVETVPVKKRGRPAKAK